MLLTFIVEAVLSAALTLVFWVHHDYPIGDATWNGVFTTVSAFNNAGFALFSDGLIGFQTDPLVLLTVAAAIILGGLGLPVYLDFRAHGLSHPRRWSVHTRLTLGTSLVLLVVGTIGFTVFESGIPGTTPSTELLNGYFSSVTARTAGFNSIDYGTASEETLLMTSFLMIIGGGSASTAGGIKVTTFVILILVLVAEARGQRDVNIGDRRMPERAIRTALAVTVSYAFLVAVGAMASAGHIRLPLHRRAVRDRVGDRNRRPVDRHHQQPEQRRPHRPDGAHVRGSALGALTLASAFVLRRRDARYRLPEGQPIIGSSRDRCGGSHGQNVADDTVVVIGLGRFGAEVRAHDDGAGTRGPGHRNGPRPGPAARPALDPGRGGRCHRRGGPAPPGCR